MAVRLVKQDFPVIHLADYPNHLSEMLSRRILFHYNTKGLGEADWLADSQIVLLGFFAEWYFLFSSLLEHLLIPGHLKINKSGPAMALASSLNTWVQSVRLTEFQVKCTLPQSCTTKVPDFPSSLRGLNSCMLVLLVVTDAKAAQNTSAFSTSSVISFPAPFNSRLTFAAHVLEESLLAILPEG